MKTTCLTNATIKLNQTFMQLATGVASLGDIIAERQAARAAQLAKEDAYSRRHREQMELSDAFTMNYCH